MEMGSGDSGVEKIRAATAPARCALLTLVSNEQVPREMRPMRPARLLAGSAVQARPPSSSVATSASSAVIDVDGVGPSPKVATREERPGISTLAAKVRSLLVAPTAIAEGAVAGEAMVLRPGPLLPAATTTITPACDARSMACT